MVREQAPPPHNCIVHTVFVHRWPGDVTLVQCMTCGKLTYSNKPLIKGKK